MRPIPSEILEPSSPAAAPAGTAASWQRTAVAILVLVGVLGVFFAPALLTGDQFLYRDNGRMHWPVKRYVAERLRLGELPEWNPYVGLGVPLVAGAVDAVQHPFNLLLVVFPFETGFKAWALLSYLLAATGAFAWARALGRSRTASVAAGLAFALSGSLVSSSDNLQYLTTLAALPCVFVAAHRWLERRRPGDLALLGLASGLCAAGGDPQAWGFAVASLPAYALVMVESGERSWRRLARGAAGAGAALAGAAPFVLPVVAWLPHTSRGAALDATELQRWTLPLPRILELVLPHMYRDAPGTLSSPVYIAFGGGEVSPIPWVLSVYAGVSVAALALAGAARAKRARWLLVGAAACTWMALGDHAGFGQLLPHLPVLSGFRYWEKMAIWPALLLPVAAAFGFDEVVSGRVRARVAAAIVAMGAVALALHAWGRLAPEAAVRLFHPERTSPGAAAAFAGNLLEGLLHAGSVCLLLGLTLVAIRRGLVRRSPAPLLCLVVVGDLFAANVRGYVLASPAVVEPRSRFGEFLHAQPGLQRVFTPFEITRDRWPELRDFESGWMWAARTLDASFNLQHRVGNFSPYTGMIPDRFDRFKRRAPLARQLPAIGLFGVGYLSVPASPSKAAAAGLSPPWDVAVADPDMPAYLLRVPHRTRAYIASELASVDRRGAMEFVLGADPARTARSVVEGPLPDGYQTAVGTARVLGDAPERVVVEATVDRRGLVVLNDTYAPGWSATVDGRTAEILPTNYLVRGVWVDAGTHVVAFEYRTPWLRAGWTVLALGLAAVAMGATWSARRRGPQGGSRGR